MAKATKETDRMIYTLTSFAFPTFPIDMAMPVFYDGDKYNVVLGCGWASYETDSKKIESSDDYADRITEQTKLRDTKGFKIALIKKGTLVTDFKEIESKDDRAYFAMPITKDLIVKYEGDEMTGLVNILD